MLYRIDNNIVSRSINIKTTIMAATSTALLASSLILTSCSTPITREGRIGADDGSDVCYSQRVALDSTGNFFAEDMIKGALVGAGVGAGLGAISAIVSGQSGKDVAKSALIGGVAGGVAGAIGGYYKSRMDRGRDQAILAINDDLSREVGELEKTDIAFDKLFSCRIGQRDQIRADYAAKLISREEAEKRWNQLQSQIRSDSELMRMVSENIGKRQEEYQYASNQIMNDFDISKLSVAERKVVEKRIKEQDQIIDIEYKDEVKRIEKDQTIPKSYKNKQITVAKNKQVAKKSANKKTGGNKEAIQISGNLSASQAKKESIDNKNVALLKASDGGFDTANLRDDLWMNRWALRNQCCTINDFEISQALS